MDFIGFYILFAVTTGLMFLIEFYIPIMQNIEIIKPEHVLIRSKYTSIVTMFFMGVLTAPLLIIPCIIPSIGKSFRDSLQEAMLKD